MKHTRTTMMALLLALVAVAGYGQNIVANEVDARNTLLVPRLTSLPTYGRAGALVYKMNGADSGLYLRRVGGTGWLKLWPIEGGSGYEAGANLRLDGNVFRLADTLGGNNFVNTTHLRAIGTYNLRGTNNVNLLGVEASLRSFANNSFNATSTAGLQLNTADSIRFTDAFADPAKQAYKPQVNSTAGYRVALMDTNSGAFVTIDPSLFGGGSGYLAGTNLRLDGNVFRLADTLNANTVLNADSGLSVSYKGEFGNRTFFGNFQPAPSAFGYTFPNGGLVGFSDNKTSASNFITLDQIVDGGMGFYGFAEGFYWKTRNSDGGYANVEHLRNMWSAYAEQSGRRTGLFAIPGNQPSDKATVLILSNDSIYLVNQPPGAFIKSAYRATASSIGKYRIAVMDSTTGALVTVDPSVLGGGSSSNIYTSDGSLASSVTRTMTLGDGSSLNFQTADPGTGALTLSSAGASDNFVLYAKSEVAGQRADLFNGFGFAQLKLVDFDGRGLGSPSTSGVQVTKGAKGEVHIAGRKVRLMTDTETGFDAPYELTTASKLGKLVMLLNPADSGTIELIPVDSLGSGGSGGSFNPIITSPQNGQGLFYDSVAGNYTNQFPPAVLDQSNTQAGGLRCTNCATQTFHDSSYTTRQYADGRYAAASHTHAAADIVSGVVAPARLGTGTANSGTVLHGDGVWRTVSAGSGTAKWNFDAYSINGFGTWPVTAAVNGTSASAASASTTTERGTGTLGTGTTTTGRAAIASQAAGIVLNAADDSVRAKWRIRTVQASDGTDTYTLRLGFGDFGGANGDGTDGMYFRYSSATNGGRWEGVTISNSTASTVDLGGSSVAANTNYDLEVACKTSGCTFYLNGLSVGSLTTNIPSGSGREFGIAAKIEKTAGTNNRNVLVYRLAYRLTGDGDTF